jgi:cell division protein FtsL
MAIMKERLNTEAAILRERLKTFTIVGTVSLTLTIGVIGWFDHRFNNVETKMEQLRSEIASENTKVHDDINSFRNRLNARGM